MNFKNLLKKKLGNHYYKIRSKYILTKLFAEELGNSYELVYDYYGRFIEEIEEPVDFSSPFL